MSEAVKQIFANAETREGFIKSFSDAFRISAIGLGTDRAKLPAAREIATHVATSGFIPLSEITDVFLYRAPLIMQLAALDSSVQSDANSRSSYFIDSLKNLHELGGLDEVLNAVHKLSGKGLLTLVFEQVKNSTLLAPVEKFFREQPQYIPAAVVGDTTEGLTEFKEALQKNPHKTAYTEFGNLVARDVNVAKNAKPGVVALQALFSSNVVSNVGNAFPPTEEGDRLFAATLKLYRQQAETLQPEEFGAFLRQATPRIRAQAGYKPQP